MFWRVLIPPLPPPIWQRLHTGDQPRGRSVAFAGRGRGKAVHLYRTDPSWLLQAAISRPSDRRIRVEDRQFPATRADELAAVISRAESDAAGFPRTPGVAQTVEDMRKQLEVLQAGSKLQMLMATDNRAEMARSLAYAEQTAEGAKRDQAGVEADRNAYFKAGERKFPKSLSKQPTN